MPAVKKQIGTYNHIGMTITERLFGVLLEDQMPKRKSLIAEEQRLLETLKRCGYTGKMSKHFVNKIPDYKIQARFPTSDRVCSSGPQKPSQVYSGTEILGIATMHKSNIVPVSRNGNDAIEISKMRRQ